MVWGFFIQSATSLSNINENYWIEQYNKELDSMMKSINSNGEKNSKHENKEKPLYSNFSDLLFSMFFTPSGTLANPKLKDKRISIILNRINREIWFRKHSGSNSMFPVNSKVFYDGEGNKKENITSDSELDYSKLYREFDIKGVSKPRENFVTPEEDEFLENEELNFEKSTLFKKGVINEAFSSYRETLEGKWSLIKNSIDDKEEDYSSIDPGSVEYGMFLLNLNEENVKQKVVLWRLVGKLVYSLVLEQDEDFVLAHNFLHFLVAQLISFLKISHPALTAIDIQRKPEVVISFLDTFLPSGQLLFLTPELCKQMRKKIEINLQ